jgi:hypothetical protein
MISSGLLHGDVGTEIEFTLRDKKMKALKTNRPGYRGMNKKDSFINPNAL